MSEPSIRIQAGRGEHIQLGCGSLTVLLLLWLVWNSACATDPVPNPGLEAKIGDLQSEVWQLRRSIEQLRAMAVERPCAEAPTTTPPEGAGGGENAPTP